MQDHHHRSPELPRHWVTLPGSVRTNALSHPLLRGLFPSHVGFFPDAAQHRIHRPEGVEQTIFKYCVNGIGWCELEGRRFDVGPGDLMVVPRGMPHAYGSSEKHPWTVHWFHAMGVNVELFLQEIGVTKSRPVVSIGCDARLIALFEELRQLLEDDYSPSRLLYASQLLSHLLASIVRLRRESSIEAQDAERRVLQSIAFMKQQLGKPLRVATLAGISSLSVSHYSALFRRLTGYSPKDYSTRLRLHRAAQLLSTTDQSVKSVSRALGYEDPLYFSRAFRRVNGVSPSRYRSVQRRRVVPG